MAGATAATAAGVTTASQASTITVNLINNYISATGGNHLNADLTGDGHPDVTIANPSFFHSTRYIGYTKFYNGAARVVLNGINATAFAYGDGYPVGVRLGSQFRSLRSPPYGTTLTGSIPIFFKDLHINGGAPTKGSLEVTLSDFFPSDNPRIQLDSFTYNDPPSGRGAAVPDQGSSLALLAMGAGGILALRRWRAAQERS